MNVALFFTYDVSLSQWEKLKIIDREMKFYSEITNNFDEIKFTLITYGNNEDLKYRDRYKNISIIPVYSINKRPSNKFLRFLDSLVIPFKIKKQLTHIDIFKTNQLLGCWIPVILKKLLKKPLIIRTGYDIFSFSLKQKKNIFKLCFYYLLTQIAILSSDKYLVSSTGDKDFLIKNFYWKNNKKIKVRNNWISEDIDFDILNRENKKILTVGRLEEQKNLFDLISKFKDTEYVLDIVGEGSQKDQLVLHSKKNNVNTNFLGLINHEELLDLYKNYKFFIMNSIYEGHPKALIEAMSRGCIVVVNENSSVKEIISNNVNGILFDSFKENPIKFIETLNKDDQLTLDISDNAIKFANDNYSISKMIDLEIKTYKELIKN